MRRGPLPLPARLAPLALAALLAGLGCDGQGRSDVSAGPGGDPLAGVAASAEAAMPLAVGARLPDVTVRDVEGRAVALPALVAEGAVALVFYRGGW